MSNRAHRARRDTSEPEVIEALEKCGYRWKKLAQKGIPDLLVWNPYIGTPVQGELRISELWLVEVKTGKGKHRATQNWHEMELPVVTLRCAEDVFSWHMGQKVRVAKGG